MVTFHKRENFVSEFTAVEYHMPQEMADMFIKTAKSEKSKLNPQEYLVNLVNEQFGIKGHCVKVVTF